MRVFQGISARLSRWVICFEEIRSRHKWSQSSWSDHSFGPGLLWEVCPNFCLVWCSVTSEDKSNMVISDLIIEELSNAFINTYNVRFFVFFFFTFLNNSLSFSKLRCVAIFHVWKKVIRYTIVLYIGRCALKLKNICYSRALYSTSKSKALTLQ